MSQQLANFMDMLKRCPLGVTWVSHRPSLILPDFQIDSNYDWGITPKSQCRLVTI